MKCFDRGAIIVKKARVFTLCLLSAALVSCSAEKTESSQPESTDSATVTSSQTEEAEVRSADTIIEDIIAYHGSYGKQADGKVNELLAELSNIDERQGKLWADIIDYWNYANDELEVHKDKLPDDLPQDDSLCIVVLGFELNQDGTMKDELIGRLKVAKACAEQYPNAYIVCTGGGTAKNNPDATEADLMGNWLLENGLDEKRLIIENRSLTTAENARFSYGILLNEHPQVNSVAIVSSSYHIAWGSLLFESEFMRIASEQETPEIHVISNCAYDTVNDDYKLSEILRWETGGMMQLIGNNDRAMEYYTNTYTKPEWGVDYSDSAN